MLLLQCNSIIDIHTLQIYENSAQSRGLDTCIIIAHICTLSTHTCKSKTGHKIIGVLRVRVPGHIYVGSRAFVMSACWAFKNKSICMLWMLWTMWMSRNRREYDPEKCSYLSTASAQRCAVPSPQKCPLELLNSSHYDDVHVHVGVLRYRTCFSSSESRNTQV
jgi:hypothetical protein